MPNATKAGTGTGSLLVISSTAATLAVPAPAPSSNPSAWTLAPTASPTGIAVLQMKDFTMPDQKLSFDDVTNTSSPLGIGQGVIKESIPTVLDPGEFSCTGIFLPSDPGLIALQSAFASGLANQFQVQLGLIGGQSTTGNVYEFNGYLQSNPVPVGISAEKAVTVKISIKLNSILTCKTGS